MEMSWFVCQGTIFPNCLRLDHLVVLPDGNGDEWASPNLPWSPCVNRHTVVKTDKSMKN